MSIKWLPTYPPDDRPPDLRPKAIRPPDGSISVPYREYEWPVMIAWPGWAKEEHPMLVAGRAFRFDDLKGVEIRSGVFGSWPSPLGRRQWKEWRCMWFMPELPSEFPTPTAASDAAVVDGTK